MKVYEIYDFDGIRKTPTGILRVSTAMSYRHHYVLSSFFPAKWNLFITFLYFALKKVWERRGELVVVPYSPAAPCSEASYNIPCPPRGRSSNPSSSVAGKKKLHSVPYNNCIPASAVRSLMKFNATITSQLPAGTAIIQESWLYYFMGRYLYRENLTALGGKSCTSSTKRRSDSCV